MTDKLRWIDTHCHLTDEVFLEDIDDVILRARDAGVKRIIVSSWDRPSINAVLMLARRYPEVYCTIGIHPSDCDQLTDECEAYIRGMARQADALKIVAIGEIGMDYHYDGIDKEMQKDAFRRQLRIAKEMDLPVVVHERDAHEDALNLLLEHQADEGLRSVPGVFHCYSGSAEFAKRLLPMGWYFGFDGPLTFKNGKKPREAAAAIPLDKLLIETDAPYLTPHPHRGKRNEPAYVDLVGIEMAELFGMEIGEMAEQLWHNSVTLYPLLRDL